MFGIFFVERRMDVALDARAGEALAKHYGHVFIDGTGVGLLLRDPQLGEQVQDRARFYLELPRQFVDPDFLHIP
jgi:hypothetical protein